MRYRITFAALYAEVYKARAIKAAANTKEKIVENKSELTCIVATTVVVGLAARVAGFKAGYEFASSK